ncbi:MAG: oligopeptide transporter, OPT family [Phycisphaeraceae bacterium]
MADQHDSTPPGPYIPATTSLPEITIKAVGLGIILSIVLGAANVYLGLKAGMTVAASIPAAVVSKGVLRLFKRSNILENNIVQTAASAGESLAAGVIFTIPALVLLGEWQAFDYWQTTMLAALGGVVGVLFTVPLRRALVVHSDLAFPEGVATAEVLKVGQGGEAGISRLLAGGGIGAAFKFGESGLRLWSGAAEAATRVGGSIAYIGIDLAPALVAVGYIVGLNIAVLIFLGGAANWFVAIPILAAMQDLPDAPAAAGAAHTLWSTQTRYIGVGAMVVGGLWALLRLWPHLVVGIRSGLQAYRTLRTNGADSLARTDRDAPLPWIGAAVIVCVIPLFFVFESVTGQVWVAAVMAVVMLAAAFVFSAVASYMAGLVGSSNNPVSGVTIATILMSSLLLLAMGTESAIGPAAAIFIGAVVCCAAAIGGDNMQDLKAGQLVGATPWKQQVVQVIGVLAAALVMAPVLTALLRAYGIGPITVEGQQALAAPQATLMASVAQGVFARDLPWDLVAIGAAAAVVVIVIDLILEIRGTAFRAPVLAVAVGLYLPLGLATALLAGGLVAWAASRFHIRRMADEAEGQLSSKRREARDMGQRHGLLFAAGLITGEALLGIALAIPIAAMAGHNPLALADWRPLTWPGLVLLAVVMVMLYRVATRTAPSDVSG